LFIRAAWPEKYYDAESFCWFPSGLLSPTLLTLFPGNESFFLGNKSFFLGNESFFLTSIV
jgi:hypothetical protein